jgi:DNA repair exonuclease SbcCD nuclease subunit
VKIIHTADLHLGSKLTANLNKEKANVRKAEILSNFSRLLSVAEEMGVSVIIIAGDLFDTKRITKHVASEVLSSLETHPLIKVIYVVGNHEDSALKEVVDELPSNFICIDDTQWQYVNIDDVTIAGANLVESNGQILLNTLILDKNNKNIVVLHGETSNHKSDIPVAKINIPTLKNKNIDYLALGHYHSFEIDRIDERGIYAYSGCLEGRGFDETDEKGFVLIDTDDIQNPTFIPFAKRLLREVVIDVTGVSEWKDIRSLVSRTVNDIPRQDLIKVVLVGTYDDSSNTVIYTEELERSLNTVFWFAKVYNKTTLAYSESESVDGVGIKQEFLRKIYADETLTKDEKSEIYQLSIKALKGEDL